MSNEKTPATTQASIVMLGKCPICRKRSTLDARPFCSKHCADVDFSRWVGGNYAIPVTEPEDIDALIAELEDDDNTDKL
jgi:hypothetical protein